MSMNRLIEEKREVVAILCAKHKVRRLELFGSAATDKSFSEAKSDLDFLVEFQPISPEEYADAYFDLLFDLQKLFNHTIDLVTEKSIKNPYFLQSIQPSRILLYAA